MDLIMVMLGAREGQLAVTAASYTPGPHLAMSGPRADGQHSQHHHTLAAHSRITWDPDALTDCDGC
jgi:hypothetical protein